MHDYRYFKVTGGKILDCHNQWLAERKAARAAIKAAQAQYGADGSYGTHRGLTGLVFKEPPKGWRVIRGAETTDRGGVKFYACKPPLGKEGKAIKEQLATLKNPDAERYHELITGSESAPLGFYEICESTGRLRCFFVVFETVGDSIILKVPVCKEGDRWAPPDSECAALKTSEYWALKEAEVSDKENKTAA